MKPCPICNGSGKVITGYRVICTELVEKVEKCPECKGKGCLDEALSFILAIYAVFNYYSI